MKHKHAQLSVVAAIVFIADVDRVNAQLSPTSEPKFGATIIRATMPDKAATNTHQIKMHVGRSYQIMVKSSNPVVQAIVKIADDNGRVVMHNTGSGAASIEYAPPRTGTYRLIVGSTGQMGLRGYTISIRPEVGFSLRVFKGSLTRTDPFDKLRPRCYMKSHMIYLRAGQIYTIDLVGNYDPWLRIENANGMNLAQDDDGGAGLNSRLMFRPPQSGQYRLIATSCGSNQVGNYTMTVRRHRVIFSTQSKLTKKDPKDRILTTSYSKTFTVQLKAGRSYMFEYSPVQYSPYFRLELNGVRGYPTNRSGTSGRSVSLQYTAPQSGPCRIVVGTSGAGQTGDFTLNVYER